MKFLVICLMAVLFLVPVGMAAELHVRLSPGPGEYSRLQDAWENVSSGDTILIHAGTYNNPFYKNIQLHTARYGNDPVLTDVLITNAGDGRVTLNGAIKVGATTEGMHDNITFDGLFLNLGRDDGRYNRSGFYLTANFGTTLGAINIRNCVVYNDGADGINDQALLYMEGGGVYMQSTIEKCTQINLGANIGDDYGIRQHSNVGPMILPVVRNVIIWNNNVGVRFESAKDNFKIDYSDVGNSASYNFWNNNAGVGTIEDVDPMFYSLDPAEPYFLYLTEATPVSVKYGAHDGTYMGALPVYVPEPPECGDWGYHSGDLNEDCYVNFADLVTFVSEWLDCTKLADPNCG